MMPVMIMSVATEVRVKYYSFFILPAAGNSAMPISAFLVLSFHFPILSEHGQ